MEKNTVSVVRFNSEALKQDAKVQGQQLANCCMQDLKHAAGERAHSAVHRLFDYLIDLMNAKLSA